MSNIKNVNDLRIKKFFESDNWDFTNFPVEEIAKVYKGMFLVYRTLDISICKSKEKKEEIRKLFISCFTKSYPYSAKSKRIKFLFYLPELSNMFDEDSFLEIEESKLIGLFQEIIDKHNISSELIKTMPTMQAALYEIKDTRKGCDRDIWYMKDFKIDKTRMNESTPLTSINFRKIINLENREYTKKWFKYLLGCTELAIATIYNYLPMLSDFFNMYSHKSMLDMTPDEVEKYADTIKGSANTRNRFVNSLSDFYKWLSIHQIMTKPSPVQRNHLKKDKYVPADNLVSEHTILQIFRKLHLLRFDYRCMYCINYSTGMRISDICMLKTDCLYEDGEGGFYIRFFNQKMQKELMVLITNALYLMIKDRIKEIKELDYTEQYLFPATKTPNMPHNSQTYRNYIKRWCKDQKITNDDGSVYNYTTHSYRHTIATDLLQNYDVDLQVIQLAVLGHQEIQMTLSYAQRGDNFNKALHDKYIENAGMVSTLDKLTDEDTLQKYALPNGYCNYPSKLGVCENADICLNCEFFRTSLRFLDTHKKQLTDIKKQIIYYKANGFNSNLETALKTKATLETIIAKLEEIKSE